MNEVTKSTGSELAVNATARGFEEPTEQSELIIPRAKLFQGTPTEQQEYPDAKAGQILNSLTKEVLPATFVPVFKYTEVVKFNGRNQKDEGFDPSYAPGALIWKCNDPRDQRWQEGEFGPNGEKPTAMRTMNFLSYFVGCPMPVIVSFAKTSFRTGKQLLSLAQFAGGDMFGRRYKLGTKKEESDGNIYHIFTVAVDGIATPEEKAIAEGWYKSLRGKDLNVHEEAPQAAPDWRE